MQNNHSIGYPKFSTGFQEAQYPKNNSLLTLGAV